jgi:two-component system sensor histidine kinase PhoQ
LGSDRASPAPSLVLRLLIGASLALIIALSLIALAVDRGFRGAAEEAQQERLESVVFLILSTLEVDAEGRPGVADSLAEPRLDQPGSGLYAGALTPKGRWQSNSLVGVVASPGQELLARNTEKVERPQGRAQWYRYAVGLGWEQPDGEIIDLTIWAAEDPGRLRRTLAGFRGDLYRWMLLAAGLVIAAQLVILTLLIRPLRRVAEEVSEVESGRKTGLDGRYPRELQPLTANLNALLATERSNASHYRQALADLAHALKTPLAVLRARLESESEGRRLESGPALDDTLTEMELLIRRQLERAARSTRRTLNQPVTVVPVLTRLANSLSRLYASDDVVFDVQGDDALTLRIDERDLMELCGNLLDNAAKYGGGRVRARVDAGRPGPRSAGVQILIEDNGPGIDADRFEELLLRGVRGDQQREGQGLGLAIARQLIEAYGGTITVDRSTLGGAALHIIFPPR